MSRPAPLALTLGDPRGVGPEIVVKAWQALRETGPDFVVVGDADCLRSAFLGGDEPTVETVQDPGEASSLFRHVLPVLDTPDERQLLPGAAADTRAASIVRWIAQAADLALQGKASGVVTAPIAKAPLYEAGFAFPGHTEFLAELTADAPHVGPRGPVMMLTARDLRTVLVTIHTPLVQVPAAVSVKNVMHTARVTAAALKRDFGVEHPRLALAGLNPHAGESGTIGREEIEVLAPAVALLRGEGIDISDPRPADTLFHEAARQTFDAVVCLYHDQALIPVKTLDFWGGVNVTLGLPIVRTSPDHGAGFDIAGQGIARADSLIHAIRLAAELAERRARAS
ncbi:MAG: 4-hydroxythreonine-4-phosphate dehydrogenase PdxA [Caulobacteraceae bacterium]|nr:4-hydroxythreonine-4-phosphate dehydrogenase PdxA [Caulobacteraceae bacterium]